MSTSRSVGRREWVWKGKEEGRIGSINAIYRDGRGNGSCVRGTVTHSPINFASPSIDHNVLFCSLVFLSAAFDSIRGCGESIYLPRCHAPPVMDGGCTLTLTTRKESPCQEPTHSLPQPASVSDPDPSSLSLFFIPPPHQSCLSLC